MTTRFERRFTVGSEKLGERVDERFDVWLERRLERIEPMWNAQVILEVACGCDWLDPKRDENDVAVDGTLDLSQNLLRRVRALRENEDHHATLIYRGDDL